MINYLRGSDASADTATYFLVKFVRTMQSQKTKLVVLDEVLFIVQCEGRGIRDGTAKESNVRDLRLS